MKMRTTLLVGALLAGVGCEEEAVTVGQRGVGGPSKPAEGPTPGAAAAGPAAAGEQAGEATPPPPSTRPRPVLTREDFAAITRDPFQSFLGTQVVEVEPDRPRAQRDVKMGEYNFEDLKLVAIVHSGRGIVPSALFLASDGKSKTIHQGEYFSRAEVLLAAVNRDYVEVEVVDESLATNLNLARGERRALYLKHE
jgi:Tfp pilus assembly protein PilP